MGLMDAWADRQIEKWRISSSRWAEGWEYGDPLDKAVESHVDLGNPVHRFFYTTYCLTKWFGISLWRSGIWLVKAAYKTALLVSAIAVIVFCCDYVSTIRPVLMAHESLNEAVHEVQSGTDKEVSAQKLREALRDIDIELKDHLMSMSRKPL